MENIKIFIVGWAIIVAIFLVRIDYVDLMSWRWWVLCLFLNIVGILVFYKLEVNNR